MRTLLIFAATDNSGRPYSHPRTIMTVTIRQQDLIDSVAAALQYISYYHPADYI
ncbi:MAG: hypothetical protein JF607_24825, partial [Burkholderiales bacterium]|nr:hypothetical protein [Burkholderiales bacterium]